MSPCTPRLVLLCTVAAVAGTSCTEVSPGENAGVFSGGNAQLAAANINRASTAQTGERLATGAPVVTTTTAVVAIIAKHQATLRQRGIAEQRARATYARLVAQRTNAPVSTRQPTAPQPAHERHAAVPSSRVANHFRKPAARKLPRYIAVETEKDAHTAPAAKKSVMIWDTETQEIVGNNVYDIASTPPAGATSRFETFSAEYVGAGL